MEKYSYYQFKVFKSSGEFPIPASDGIVAWEGWIYEIYDQDSNPELIRESDEWFETEQEARFAAIGHICLLENGEG